MNRLSFWIFAFLLAPVCLAQTRPAFPAGEEEQVRMLVKMRSRLVMASNATMLPSGLWQNRTRRTEEEVAKILAIKDGWWSPYASFSDSRVMYNGSAWKNAAILACAWDMPQSKYFESKEVMSAIEGGLRHLLKFAYPGCPRPGNWWAWEIGMPMHLLETLTLCGDGLEPGLRQQEFDTLIGVLKVGDDVKMSGPIIFPLQDSPGKTDMNELWRCRLRLQLAILLKKPAMAGKWAQKALSEIGRPGEGFWQADYSYKFHGADPMWAYGATFLSDYSNLVAIYNNTPFAPSSAQIDRFTQMALHYSNGFLYHSTICPAMTGREITRGDNVCQDFFGPPAIHALAVLARLGYPSAAEMAAIVARDGRYITNADISQQIAEWTAGCPRTVPAPSVNDTFVYPDSDFLQVTHPTWAAGIKMHSTRNRSYESINGENLQGWFLSHGSMWPMLSGIEWRYSWPALDWTRLPGTTVCRDIKTPSKSPFAGVLRLSPERVMAAMQLACGEFQARKSWVVDSDCIICQGSSIKGPGRVETTIFNQPVGADARILVDGQELPAEVFHQNKPVHWIWFERVGYLFPQPQKLRVLREKRSSDWSSIREAKRHGAGEMRESWFVTGVLSHSPDQTGYTYLVLPDVSLDQMEERVKSVEARYRLSTDSSHDVVAADSSWETHAIWSAQPTGAIQTSAGCLLTRTAQQWTGVDPTWEAKRIQIKLNGSVFDLTTEHGRAGQLSVSSK